MPPLDPKPDRGCPFLDNLRTRCPDVTETAARSLASLWGEELDLIISRMMEISGERKGLGLHIDSRPDGILQLASLRLWLTDLIVNRKLEHAAAGTLDPEAERRFAKSAEWRTRIEETAQMCAEHIWDKLIDQWRQKWPLVVPPGRVRSRRAPKVPKTQKQQQFVRRNHWSPVFSNRYWTGSDGVTIRVYQRGVDGGISSKDLSYKKWGYEPHLYSQRLENWLSLIDDDGACSQRKMLDSIPLNDLDKRRWIAFLAIQAVRTPSSIAQMIAGLKRRLPTIAPDYPTDIASLKRANETIFTNNALYAEFHRLIAPREWLLLRAPAGSTFIRPDQPVVIAGSLATNNWWLLYPMTPTCVFSAGPELGKGYEADFVPSRNIDALTCEGMNGMFASRCQQSAVAVPTADDQSLRALLHTYLASEGGKRDSSTGLWVSM